MTKEEFVSDVMTHVKNRPQYIRKGQAVFNYIEEKYHVARDVQFEDNIDCFYVDASIDSFIDAAYKRLN